MEASHNNIIIIQLYCRPSTPHKMGKDAKKNEYLVPVKTIDQTFEIHTGLRVC